MFLAWSLGAIYVVWMHVKSFLTWKKRLKMVSSLVFGYVAHAMDACEVVFYLEEMTKIVFY